jgi:hypothetical protein
MQTKLNEPNGIDSSVADTEQDRRDSKRKDVGDIQGQKCLVSGKKTKRENITGVRGRRCQLSSFD